jgi:hypothetical protein
VYARAVCEIVSVIVFGNVRSKSELVGTTLEYSNEGVPPLDSFHSNGSVITSEDVDVNVPVVFSIDEADIDGVAIFSRYTELPVGTNVDVAGFK